MTLRGFIVANALTLASCAGASNVPVPPEYKPPAVTCRTFDDALKVQYQDWLDARGEPLVVESACSDSRVAHLVLSGQVNHSIGDVAAIAAGLVLKAAVLSGHTNRNVRLTLKLEAPCGPPTDYEISSDEHGLSVNTTADPELTCLAPTDGEVELALGNSSVSGATSKSVADVEQLLRRHFTLLGEVAVAQQRGNTLELTVRSLRGQVIKGNRYWERLQIFLVATPEGRKLRLNMAIDGQFCAGLTAPPDTAYRDMEPQHSGSLLGYAKSLMADLVRGLSP